MTICPVLSLRWCVVRVAFLAAAPAAAAAAVAPAAAAAAVAC